ncbi:MULTISPECIES: type IV pilus twitching motility protein PilT [Ferrimicrobium]|uniref:Type IV pilus twitching motility protein PilT n=1 Tax=Ferrimicrobium acidiphilum TaxID=121039 RepID=A0ABV3Y2U9_9ACTN|nr:type IV pilus twitching motility protein PilT [Ferrimicrobium sp.]
MPVLGTYDQISIDSLLGELIAAHGSDLHLSVGARPLIRVYGALRELEGSPELDPETIRDGVYAILTQAQRERFEESWELDLAYSLRGLGRFRLNLFRQRSSIGAVFRVIPHQIPPLDTLELPPVVKTFAEIPKGLVLVTGPTGSGKSTTLAAIIDLINRTQRRHIVTIEDPIEFLHSHRSSIVNQREVGTDTKAFATALRQVLRQDPDVIMVGEMRDFETIAAAITAAETGHLVFATLHTQDAPQAIDRMIDVFPSSQQAQIRVQLAASLQAILTQQLIARCDQPGRAVAVEVLVATSAVRNVIREAKSHQLYSIMQSSAQMGMQTMDSALLRLVKLGHITRESALLATTNQRELYEAMGGLSARNL